MLMRTSVICDSLISLLTFRLLNLKKNIIILPVLGFKIDKQHTLSSLKTILLQSVSFHFVFGNIHYYLSCQESWRDDTDVLTSQCLSSWFIRLQCEALLMCKSSTSNICYSIDHMDWCGWSRWLCALFLPPSLFHVYSSWSCVLGWRGQLSIIGEDDSWVTDMSSCTSLLEPPNKSATVHIRLCN